MTNLTRICIIEETYICIKAMFEFTGLLGSNIKSTFRKVITTLNALREGTCRMLFLSKVLETKSLSKALLRM